MIADKQYAEVTVNGKTGTRQLPIINALPYLKDYMDTCVGDPKSYLIRSAKTFGKLGSRSVNAIYAHYKQEYFPRLLKEPDDIVPKKDKEAIKLLLAKPWSPYIFRHSALTAYSKVLKESVLRSHAGWTHRSPMPERYLHYFGNESSESILQAMGLKPSSPEELNKLAPVICPNCGEGNKQQVRFCANKACRMVLSFDAYTDAVGEAVDNKNKELESLQQRIGQLEVSADQFQRLADKIRALEVKIS
jgi:hypothetical protein